MKTKSIEKLVRLGDQSKKEGVESMIKWAEAQGQDITPREKTAMEAGFATGFLAAIAMIQLHNLK